MSIKGGIGGNAALWRIEYISIKKKLVVKRRDKFILEEREKKKQKMIHW